MTNEQQLIAKFHAAFNIADPATPQIPGATDGAGRFKPNYDLMIKRFNLIFEELLELAHDGFGIEFHFGGMNSRALQENIENFAWRTIGTPDLTKIADACADLKVVTMGTECEFGIDGEPVFEEVMRANMSKLGPDGKPILRALDGKILKGENYTPPDIATVLALQMPQESSETPGPLSPPQPEPQTQDAGSLAAAAEPAETRPARSRRVQ